VLDKKEGYGEYSWHDGRMYKGNWKNGKMQGEGQLIGVDGKVVNSIWENGKRIKDENSKNDPNLSNLQEVN
jgi:hypothetical protein